jgi:oligosaccharide repeat unit polymerase
MSSAIGSSTTDRNLPPDRIGHLASIVSLLLTLLILLFLRQWLQLLTTTTLSLIASLLTLAAVALVIARASGGLWTASSICLVILVVFHIGALPEVVVSGRSSLLTNNTWLFTDLGGEAIWLGLVGIISCCIGIVWLSRAPRGQTVRPPPQSVDSDNRLAAAVALVGASLVIVAVTGWLMFFLRAGLTWGSSYGAYLDARQQGPVQLIYDAIGVGLGFACIQPRSRLSRVAFFAFAIFAITAFPLGLRGEVLFPLATAAALLSASYRMPGRVLTLVGVVIMLGISGATSVIRVVGFGHRSIALSDFSPTNALAELGGSLRVIRVITHWNLTNGGALLEGRTYFYPIVDSIARYIFQVPFPEAHQQFFLNRLIAEREGTIGGSIIAESYANFGTAGMIIFMFGVGLLLSRLDSLQPTAHSLALKATIVFAFMTHVRNSFANVPLVLLVAAVGFGFALLLKSMGVGSASARRSTAQEFRPTQ